MVFSSYLFLFWFLPIVLCCYYITKGKIRHAILTCFSYFFYGWSNPWFVFLLFLSTIIDYCCGLVIIGYDRKKKTSLGQLERGTVRTKRQKRAVAISIISNLTILGLFKYGNFGIENWNFLIELLSLSDSWLLPTVHIILPLGISFYTFQSMSYAIDVYRGDAKGTTSFLDFSCYVSMFPQLVAGPIIRYQEIADQLVQRTYNLEKITRGIAFFIIGFSQKILLANPCGKMADLSFDYSYRTVLQAWFGLFAYSFQIFFDFAGYSNMAIGLGLMLGFVFPKNFDTPYRSLSITEFWRRWHISLSTWLRDYLYIPLGGNRRGELRTYINLFIVMFLGGLWHGASWNFVIWGSIHGVALSIERFKLKQQCLNNSLVAKTIQWSVTYFIVLLAWVFFRASTFSSAINYLKSLFTISSRFSLASLNDSELYSPYHLLMFIICSFVVAKASTAWFWTRSLSFSKVAVLLILFVLSVAALTTQSYNPFIYFIF